MKELENFRQFLAEGDFYKDGPSVSPAALAKVFQDEIRDAKENEEDDIVPAYEKGIELLKQGVLPEKVNGIVQDMYVKITGDFSYDPTVFIDAAREIDAQKQINENVDPKTSMWARDTMDSVFDGVYDEPEVGKEISYEFNDVNDEVEYEVGPDFYKVGEQPVVAYEDEDMKVTLRKLNPNDPKAVKFNHTHQLSATIKRVIEGQLDERTPDSTNLSPGVLKFLKTFVPEEAPGSWDDINNDFVVPYNHENLDYTVEDLLDDSRVLAYKERDGVELSDLPTEYTEFDVYQLPTNDGFAIARNFAKFVPGKGLYYKITSEKPAK